MRVSGVDVVSESACEQKVILQNDVNAWTQLLEAQRSDLNAVDDYLSCKSLKNA